MHTLATYPRYINWNTSEMETEESRRNTQAFIDDGRLAALHDENHPEHREAWLDFMMCLDKGDIISRYQLSVMQLKAQLERERELHRSEMSRLKETVRAAGVWWNHCLAVRRSGRKTVKIEDMGI